MIALVGDTEIAYDDVGSGLPVVFVHAFPLNRTMWEPQVSALVGDCRCIAVDLRGFGDSAVSPPFTMARFADDVAGLLDVLQIPRAVIVGLSMGGYVALDLWRRHHDRVRAFVLADTRAAADAPEQRERRRHLADIAQTEGSTAVANQQIAGLVGKTTREKRPDVYDATHRMIAQAPVDGIVGGLEAMMQRPDSTALLSEISAPTLLVVGEEDAITPAKEMRAMQRCIPGSRLEVIAQAGHLSNVERPAAFNAVVSEFLGALLYN